MGFKRFSLLVMLRTVFVMLVLLLLAVLIVTPGYHAATLVTVMLLTLLCLDLLKFVSKTNEELVRFFDAARYADFSQRFDLTSLGSGFGELGEAFGDILNRFQHVRANQEEELRHLKAVVEHVPVPLLSLHHDKSLTLWNNAARRLFGAHHVTQLEDLKAFGTELANQLPQIRAGERRLVTVEVDAMEHQLTLSATQISLPHTQEMLVSMQDIQSELDVAQLKAWQDLVRVLTHEIMNSITPVASLAKTAVDLVEDAKTRVCDDTTLLEELNDIADAVTTVARRSEGLTQFVSSYRKLTRLPPPKKGRVRLQNLFDQVQQLMAPDWPQNIVLHVDVTPPELELEVDSDMAVQMLINMLQNACQALGQQADGQVWLGARLNRRGHVVINIRDNGPGIEEQALSKIFVPFFTTKRDGSGVGLAFTRQVMIVHGGTVKLLPTEEGGASFNLTF